MEKIKDKFLKNRGSALVLAVIVLVNALFIVVAVSSISIVERKMSIKTRNTAPAFQAADSGVEYVLSRMDDDDKDTIDAVCGVPLTTDGTCIISLSDSIKDVRIYFLGTDDKIITEGSTSPNLVRSIRSVGKFGGENYATTRAIEVVLAATTAGITGGCKIESGAVSSAWGDGCDSAAAALGLGCEDANETDFQCGKINNDDYCLCVGD